MAIKLLMNDTLEHIAVLEHLIGEAWACDTVLQIVLYKLLDDANARLNELRGLE